VVHDKGPAAHVMAFENLSDDSSPDVPKTLSPKRTGEKRPTPPPSLSGWFLRCIFALFWQALM
jgi:hypothetical protein